MLDPAPSSLSDLLSPAWLSGALDDLGEGEEVVAASVTGTSKTLASKIRFQVEVTGPGGARTTRRYCVKGQFDDAESRIVNLDVEARCYRDLLPGLGARTPRAYYTGIEGETGRSVIIMDDLQSCGATFLDSQSSYSVERTAAALGQLALLHARTWGEERLKPLDWLRPGTPHVWDVIPTEVLQASIDDGRSEGLPAPLRDAARVKQAMQIVMAPQRVCVVHGDPHSLNIYLDADGQPGLLDWQLAHIGHWATDVGYHIASVLDIEARREHEESLLRGYLQELAALGVEPPPWDEAWEEYCSHIVYGYCLWSIAKVTPRVDIVEHIPRLGTALADHDTFARLGL